MTKAIGIRQKQYAEFVIQTANNAAETECSPSSGGTGSMHPSCTRTHRWLSTAQRIEPASTREGVLVQLKRQLKEAEPSRDEVEEALENTGELDAKVDERNRAFGQGCGGKQFPSVEQVQPSKRWP